jgi:hypothetical protein
VPAAAEELTANVTVEVLLVVVGLKAAVTPLGSPDTPRITVPLKLFSGVTVIVATPVLDRVRLSADAELDSKKDGCPDVPVKSLTRCCPPGEPHPVARSYPLTAENPPLFPLLMSWRSVV